MAIAFTGRLVQHADAAPWVRPLEKYFYFRMSLFILVLVTAMFSTTVPARLFHPKIAPPYILWFHGAVFYGWVLFFVLQSGLVRIRKTRWHRTIGWFGLALGVAVVSLGVSITIVLHRFEFVTLHRGRDAIIGISVPLWDMLCFVAVVSLAILWRKKLEYHRRLMLLASCALTAAAWGRVPESVLPGFCSTPASTCLSWWERFAICWWTGGFTACISSPCRSSLPARLRSRTLRLPSGGCASPTPSSSEKGEHCEWRKKTACVDDPSGAGRPGYLAGGISAKPERGETRGSGSSFTFSVCNGHYLAAKQEEAGTEMTSGS